MYSIFYSCFLFLIYSFCGWIIEELYSLFKTHKLQSDGFLNVPLKPMYGISMAILIIFYETFQINNIFMLFLCFIIPSVTEYISGYWLYRIFNKTYWDYSSIKYNINGYVCLKFSLYWTILSWIGVIYINPIIRNYYAINSYIINMFTIILFIIFWSDLTLILLRKTKGKA